MNIKVCGIIELKQMQQLDALNVEFVGMDFQSDSPRFIGEKLAKNDIKKADFDFKKVGIFIRSSVDFLLLISLIIFNPELQLFLTILGIQFLGVVLIIISILGKYSNFPSSSNPVQMFSIIFSISFPPILILVIPFLYTKSIKNLKYILE